MNGTDTTSGRRRQHEADRAYFEQALTDPAERTYHLRPAVPPPMPAAGVHGHRRRTSSAVVVLAALAAAVVLVIGGLVALVAIDAQAPARHALTAPTVTGVPSPYHPATPSAAASTGTPAAHVTTAAPAPTKAAPVVPAPPPPVARTIPDGTWTIGEDFPAGTYRATGAPPECYWEVDRSGSNGSDIVNNGAGPGNLRVVLKTGQDFHSQNCGDWEKIK
jgi:hypothetical protein